MATGESVANRFINALRIWNRKAITLGRDEFIKLWVGSQCAVVAGAAERSGKLTHGMSGALDRACEGLSDQGFAKNGAKSIVSDVGSSDEAVEATQNARAQLIQVCRGLCHGVRAACRLAAVGFKPGDLLPEGCGDDLKVALEAYEAAWDLKNVFVDTVIGTPATGPSNDPATTALDRFMQFVSCNGFNVSASTWLSVRRLVAYVLAGGSPRERLVPNWRGRPREPNEMRMLLVRDEGENGGLTAPVTLAACEEGYSCLYLDPVALGATVLDQNMLESLSGAARICRPELQSRINTDAKRYSVSLRVGPDLSDERLLIIEGKSAGGLVTAAAVGTARGYRLNRKVTASFVVDCAEEIMTDRQAPLLAENVTIIPVDHWSLFAKFGAAADAGLKTVFLSPSQLQGDIKSSWKEWEPAAQGKWPELDFKKAESLPQVIEAMTGDERIDAVLEELCQKLIADWDPTLVGRSWPTDEELRDGSSQKPRKPIPYLEPHYAKLPDDDERRELPKDSDEAEAAYRERMVLKGIRGEPLVSERTEVDLNTQKAPADEEFALLVNLGLRICVAEDANGGKTIFSHRLAYFFAEEGQWHRFFNGRAPLIVRFEGRDWPRSLDDLITKLKGEVAEGCRRHGVDADELIRKIIEDGRLVLILDSLDTAGDVEVLLPALRSDKPTRYQPGPDAAAWSVDLSKCRVIITGRTFAFGYGHERESRFPKHRYQFVTIMGFDEQQQKLGLCEGEETLKEIFQSYGDVKEVLAVPGMLHLAYEIIQVDRKEHKKKKFTDPFQVRGLRTRADFYWRYYSRLMTRAAENQKVDFEANGERWPMMMAVTAFRMVLHGAVGGTVSGVSKKNVEEDVRKYCCTQELGWNRDDRGPWEGLRRFSVLSDHGVMEGRSDAVMSWRHKGWIEFFCGLFFACYADAKALATFDFDRIPIGKSPEPRFQGLNIRDCPRNKSTSDDERASAIFRDVLTQITNDPQWEWAWRFAAEIPRIQPDADDQPPYQSLRLCHSLANLFRPPARGARPTRLIYEAYYLFEKDDVMPEHLRNVESLPGAEKVLKEFRCTKFDANTSKWRQIGWTESLDGDKLTNQSVGATFMRCPPKGWRYENDPDRDACEFWQGSDPTPGSPVPGEDENPRRLVRIKPFWMQATTVTQSQYRQFDGAFQVKWDDDLAQHPITDVTWWDAFAYCKSLGPSYRLPTEGEWEYACRAGVWDHFHFGQKLSTDQANFNSQWSKREEDAFYNDTASSLYREQTVAVEGGATFKANAFELWHMHGNVWEWCWDWYGKYSAERDCPTGPEAGWSRVIRGGSWSVLAAGCRSACRFRSEPSDRYDLLGFRPARVQSR